MLTYTSYSEAGGTGKTTLAANVAVSHARAGLDVLVVPLDPQDGDLSYLFDIDDQRADPEVDNLVRHLVGRGSGPFRELVRTVDSEYGFDIIPEHNMLERLGDALRREADQRETLGESGSSITSTHSTDSTKKSRWARATRISRATTTSFSSWPSRSPSSTPAVAMSVLHAWVYAGGSIEQTNYVPTFAVGEADPQYLATEAIQTVGLGVSVNRENDLHRATEI